MLRTLKIIAITLLLIQGDMMINLKLKTLGRKDVRFELLNPLRCSFIKRKRVTIKA